MIEVCFGLALRRGKVKRRDGTEPAGVESAAERAAQGQTEADAVAFPLGIGTSGWEMTKAGRSGLSDAAMSVPARWSRRVRRPQFKGATPV